MIGRQDIMTLLVGLLASLPGLVAFFLLKRRGISLVGTWQASSEAQALRRQLAVQESIQEQMQRQIAAQHQTILFLTSRVDELEEARQQEYSETETLRDESQALRRENEGLRRELAELRHESSELRRGLAELFRQMEAAKLTPAWTMPPIREAPPTRPTPTAAVDVAALRKRIAQHFSQDEVNDIAYDLGVDPGELSGTTTSSRSRALVEYIKDRGRLAELVEMCRSLRPDGGF